MDGGWCSWWKDMINHWSLLGARVHVRGVSWRGWDEWVCANREEREWMMTELLPRETGWWRPTLVRSFDKGWGRGGGGGGGGVWWLRDRSGLGVLCNLQPPGGLRDLLVWIKTEGRPSSPDAKQKQLCECERGKEHAKTLVCVCGKALLGGGLPHAPYNKLRRCVKTSLHDCLLS